MPSEPINLWCTNCGRVAGGSHCAQCGSTTFRDAYGRTVKRRAGASGRSGAAKAVALSTAALVVGGAQKSAEGFENGLGTWAVAAPPEGSATAAGDWEATGELFKTYGAVTTRDTVLLGFGLEHVSAPADRAKLIGKALRSLD